MLTNAKLPYCALHLIASATLLCVVGCNKELSVSGTVTVNGAPLPVGHIGFAARGQGPRVGTSVSNGAYSVGKLTPGKYQVIVTGHSGDRPVVTSREEAMKLSGKENKELVAMDHPKNGQIVEITAGTSTLDFEY